MILSAQSIRRRCLTAAMIEPFTERDTFAGMSYGLSVAGYDVRIAERTILEPGNFKLASTVERFLMPADVIGSVRDKSTWARRGLTVQNTVIEPGWRGYLTIELCNHGGDILILGKGFPVAQVIFELLDEPTQIPYSGKYQDQQSGPVAAKFEGDGDDDGRRLHAQGWRDYLDGGNGG